MGNRKTALNFKALVISILILNVLSCCHCSTNIDCKKKTETITYDHDCFQINGEDVFIYSGSMHYCRAHKSLWRDRLTKIKQAGFNTVQFYIAWNYHEPLPGKADFSELEEFIELCDEMDFYVTARIGPFICGEWDHAGYPDWLITKGIRNYALRTNENDYVEYVKYWYRQVVPVLKKYLITNGGNVILVQVENEYGGGSYFKREAIKDLYKMAREFGIDVPIVTCNTPYAWDNDDSIMADIINGNNSSIVRWKNIDKLENRVSEARNEEHNGPTIILEMPGGQGMHSNFVGYEADPLDAQDFVAVHKSALMEGAGLTSFYMLYAGTNYGYWGASYQSTSYCGQEPVQSPILEPGGLTDAYYSLKLIGQWLEQFGVKEVRSKPIADAAHIVEGAGKKPPKIIQKVNGDMAFIFIREEEDKQQKIRYSYTDPSTSKKITAPKNGYLTLPARDMQLLVANIELCDIIMQYSTSQVVCIGKTNDRKIVVLYGVDGSEGEIGLICPKKPEISGAEKFSWDEKDKSLTINYFHGDDDLVIVVDNVEFLILNKERASTTWMAEVQESIVPVVSNSYLLRSSKTKSNSLSLYIDTLPGENKFKIILPAEPETVRIDNEMLGYKWDEDKKLLDFRFRTSELPGISIKFDNAKFMKDKFSMGDGWVDTDLMPLELNEIYHKGYIRYKASFEPGEAKSMKVRFYEGSSKSDWSRQTMGDPAIVLVNGKCVPKASGWHPRKVEFDLKDYVKNGQNAVEIIMEKIGRPCGAGGWGMAEPKGLAAVTLTGDNGKPWMKVVDNWQMNLGLYGQDKGYHKPDYNDSQWQTVKLGNWKETADDASDYDGIGWYRLNFDLDIPSEWDIPLKLNMKAETDALIYINGIIAGRYNGIGWQREFYLPQCWLNLSGENVISIAVRNNGNAGGLLKAQILPYEEFTVRKNRIIIDL